MTHDQTDIRKSICSKKNRGLILLFLQCADMATMMAKFSEKQNHTGSQCMKISVSYNCGDIFREGKEETLKFFISSLN